VFTPRATFGELNPGDEDARAVHAIGNDATHNFSPTTLGDSLPAEYLLSIRWTGNGAMGEELRTLSQEGADGIDIDELVV
jgi:hypothetical protein